MVESVEDDPVEVDSDDTDKELVVGTDSADTGEELVVGSAWSLDVAKFDVRLVDEASHGSGEVLDVTEDVLGVTEDVLDATGKALDVTGILSELEVKKSHDSVLGVEVDVTESHGPCVVSCVTDSHGSVPCEVSELDPTGVTSLDVDASPFSKEEKKLSVPFTYEFLLKPSLKSLL